MIFNIFGFIGFNGKNGSESGNVAKDRLKNVLMSDRVNMQLIEDIKYDIMGVIKNYMEIDEENFRISIRQSQNKQNGAKVPMLFADFPIKKIYKN